MKGGGDGAPAQEEKKGGDAPVKAQTKVVMQRIPTASYYFSGQLADYWETILGEQQWLGGGSTPSKADAEALKHLDGKHPYPGLYPNLYAWFSMCGRFKPERMATWPDGECPIP